MSEQAISSPSAGMLASYALPVISYDHGQLTPPLRPIWEALSDHEPAAAIRLIDEIETNGSDDHRAALLAARAGAALQINDLAGARKWAERSLEHHAEQWLSVRIVTYVLAARRRYSHAHQQLASFAPGSEPRAWDTPLDAREHAMATAVLAWRARRWSKAVDHILDAFPDGPGGMPAALQRDLLRLSLSADRPQVAKSAAEQLIADSTVREADDVLQTLVHKEWLEEALALYQQLAERSPNTPWLCRRVIGLCLRVGAVEKARSVRAQLQHD